ncbi:MAG TPA: ABC transporter permease [Pyrinomonadaceae bacterium]|jgi:ABC-type multidrug transport system permease subunit
MREAKQNLEAKETRAETEAKAGSQTRGERGASASSPADGDGAAASRLESDERRRSASGATSESGATGGERRLNPLLELALARIRETLREPEVVFWVFVFPILLTFALGIAFRNTAPEKVRVALEQGSGVASSEASKRLTDALARSGEVELLTLAPEDAAQALRSGKVALVVRAREGGAGAPANDAGRDAGRNTAVGSDAQTASASTATTAQALDYRFDPTRPESRLARLVVDDALQRALGRADVARVGEERVTEPGARYIDFLIPGLIGMNLMGSGLWGVGFSIVTARMRKLLKRLSATPMRRTHYLFSFVMSRMIFLVLEVAVVIAFAWFVFGYTVRGSWLDMSVLLLLGALAFAGLGLLVAARPETIEGVSGLMNVVMMPMWLLSGTFFSSERFPAFLQPFIKALPLTALNDALRAVMNEGAPLTATWASIGILAAWCVGTFIVALRLFRWQ